MVQNWWLGPVRELRVGKQTRNEVLIKGKCGQNCQLVTRKEGAVGMSRDVKGEQRSVTQDQNSGQQKVT